MEKTNTIKVALADDHTIVRKGVSEIINAFDHFEVLFDAPNGQMLIDKMEHSPVLPDICVLDINMPEMNGYATAEYIRQHWPDIKILALSMYDSEYNIIKMLKSGANGYILKETSAMELQKALQEVYDKSFYHSELVSGRVIAMMQQGRKDNTITEREMEFLSHCCSDLSYKEIGSLMNLSGRTVEGYRDSLFQKLNIKTRTGLALFAIRIGACS